MKTITLTLPDDLASFVEEQVSVGDHHSPSDYLCDLLYKEQDREHLRALLLEGLASPLAGTADAAYFEELRERVKRGELTADEDSQASN